MPANLTPEYLAAEQRFREAETIEEKIEALQEMLATIPKHKGTEKMQADLRRRLSQLRRELGRSKGPQRRVWWRVERQGAGQIVLLGAPNTGKSLLVRQLTKAEPEVAPYPFTTHRPIPGMMPFENVAIQLVDTPAISPEHWEPWLGDVVRRADAVLLLCDLSTDEALEQVETVLERMRSIKIELVGSHPSGNPFPPGLTYRRTRIAGNKAETPEALERWEVLRELYGERFPMSLISAATGYGLEDLKRSLWEDLGVIRVYSKPPGKPPDLEEPFILKKGSTVEDLAAEVHQDFLRRLKMARVWGSTRFPGQAVERDYVLADGDVVELHV